MFCSCPNNPEERHPNENVCPICLAHPGTLPVINKKAVESVVRLGLALGGKIANHTHFDRKSYFYPDLPKGYQISQYEHPIVEGGKLNGIRVRRIHLEEDAGRLAHEGGDTLVDYNRAGVPLLELVTEPDVKNAEEAVAFANSLQQILRYLDISSADMEEGEMRVEANISVRKDTKEEFGTKVEVKNLNSFRAVGGAIAYELKRQEELLEDGKKVAQETRGWNEKSGKTEGQRSKESAHDYRYFPEPDLPPMDLSVLDLDALKAEIPELPEPKQVRFLAEYALHNTTVVLLTLDTAVADSFQKAASEFAERAGNPDYQLLADYIVSYLRGFMNEKKISFIELTEAISAEHLGHLVSLIANGTISGTLARSILPQMYASKEDPETLMQKSGTRLIGDEAELEKIITEVISKNPKPVADFKSGKGNALQFLIGQAMARTKGQASPEKLKELFAKQLGA